VSAFRFFATAPVRHAIVKQRQLIQLAGEVTLQGKIDLLPAFWIVIDPAAHKIHAYQPIDHTEMQVRGLQEITRSRSAAFFAPGRLSGLMS
jgi:hypothetical protein